jgi:2-oxoglutarate dehydrogenase E1 component
MSFSENSFIYSGNAIYVAELYKKYLQNASLVGSDWKVFFANLSDNERDLLLDIEGPAWQKRGVSVIGNKNENSSLTQAEIAEDEVKKAKQAKLEKEILQKYEKICKTGGESGVQTQEFIANTAKYIESVYVRLGHLSVNLDPLGLDIRNSVEISELKAKYKNIKELEPVFAKYDQIYCNKIGAEFSFVTNQEEYQWLSHHLEMLDFEKIRPETRKKALEYMHRAEKFENYLHTKFPGAKRFSLEGGEGYIPCLEQIFLTSSEHEVNHVVIGMAHRGRLNTLVHTLGKPYYAIFSEFMGVSSIPSDAPGQGDVKYHLGYSGTRRLENGKDVYFTLAQNPSHLEAVNPVVMGKVRAKQDLFDGGKTRRSVMGVLIHGDAAIMGQGIVAETLNMANVPGYTVGGIVHIAINNQVGFTANPCESRGGEYCTDIAKMIEAPVFHVNGNDVDSLIKVGKLAAEYRNKFGKDVFLDIVCYRKYGHNEGDEPMFTQPVMYSKIKASQTPADLYADKLIAEGVITRADFDALLDTIKNSLNQAFEKAQTYKPTKADWLEGQWKGVKFMDSIKDLDSKTAISQEAYDKVAKIIASYPEHFNINAKLKRLFGDRAVNLAKGENFDWATGELLAYGSLLAEGHNVRLSGEDCERGTFSHRQSVIYDQDTNKKYNILSPLFGKARYEVINSVLSEFGVLGFEYGYSLVNPNDLTIWEGQFGDFSNGAATIYDQFISSGEDKWLRMSGLVSLLPHGFEGQGPEHSSARLERFLQYCADFNIIVANCTTPANIFHILRRQVKATVRKPLVVMSPKSLLRNPLAVSHKSDFVDGAKFKPIIGDVIEPSKVEKVIFTSGKVYYELLAKRNEISDAKTALVRIEQYYPFEADVLKAEISQYTKASKFVWVQEEPQNMGAWHFIRDHLESATNTRPICVARKAAASPATGFASVHKSEQEDLLNRAYGA